MSITAAVYDGTVVVEFVEGAIMTPQEIAELRKRIKEAILIPRIHNAMTGDIRIPDFAYEIWADVEKMICPQKN